MFAEPFEYDMSGMVLDFFGVESRRVSAVLPASPAAAAGVEPGDALVAIDGKTLAELGDKGMFDALTRDGAVIRVTLERKGERIEKTFTLRRLV
jgi:C-terminal processing protease CtpA/Prc